MNSLNDLRPFAYGGEWNRIIELATGKPAGSGRATTDPLSHYCPHRPWPRQQVFLDLTCEEAFYGGAAAVTLAATASSCAFASRSALWGRVTA